MSPVWTATEPRPQGAIFCVILNLEKLAVVFLYEPRPQEAEFCAPFFAPLNPRTDVLGYNPVA